MTGRPSAASLGEAPTAREAGLAGSWHCVRAKCPRRREGIADLPSWTQRSTNRRKVAASVAPIGGRKEQLGRVLPRIAVGASGRQREARTAGFSGNSPGMPYLPWVMSKFLRLGFTLEQVVAMATTAPAKAINRAPKLGTLQISAPEDVAIMEIVEGPVSFVDTRNNRRDMGALSSSRCKR